MVAMHIEIQGVTMEMNDYFLLRKPHETMWYEYPLMVCSWCGDEGCGIVSVKIDRENNIVTWKDFFIEPDMKKKYRSFLF